MNNRLWLLTLAVVVTFFVEIELAEAGLWCLVILILLVLYGVAAIVFRLEQRARR